MSSRYKLSTGLWTVNDKPVFDSDQEAWEAMRVMLKGKYATLYKEIEYPCMINNREEFLEKHNSKYTSQIIDDSVPYTRTTWVPVIEGITDDPYNPNGEIEICQKTGTSTSLVAVTEVTTPE